MSNLTKILSIERTFSVPASLYSLRIAKFIVFFCACSSPGLLIDSRLFANIGRFLLAYLLSKTVNVFECEKEEVLSKRKTKFAEAHLDDYLFTHSPTFREYDGGRVSRSGLGQANKQICDQVNFL